MNSLSRAASKAGHLVCPSCESGELVRSGINGVWCDACRYQMRGAPLRTLRRIARLPDAFGAHPCECGHPEMRRLLDGIFHCPACRAEVLPAGARPVDASGEGSRCSVT